MRPRVRIGCSGGESGIPLVRLRQREPVRRKAPHFESQRDPNYWVALSSDFSEEKIGGSGIPLVRFAARAGSSQSSSLRTPLARQTIGVLLSFFGTKNGESGIRTHGTQLTYTRFPSVLLKPLGHLSIKELKTL
ncbi:MAG: hypothetical protein HW387_690 [Parachlamydiales bacterium]|nr:hypothetical protein [Parachlamydiales bacterium]